MSRSRKRTPVFGNASAGSQKEWKKQNHQTERAMARERLQRADPEAVLLPTKYEVSDLWSAPCDGKHYWAEAQPKDMRK